MFRDRHLQIFCFLLAIFAPAVMFPSSRASASPIYGNLGSVVAESEGDLDRDGMIDTVRLVGSRQVGSDGFYKLLFLEIRMGGDEGDALLFGLPATLSGYSPLMQLTAFREGGGDDIFLSVGNGGIVTAVIVSIGAEDKVPRIVFDSEVDNIPSIRGMYRNNFTAELYVVESGVSGLFSIGAYRQRLLDLGVYSPSGTLEEAVELWGIYYGSISVLPSNGEGKSRLSVIVDVCGRNLAERVARLDAVLAYESGNWKVDEFDFLPVAE